MASEDEAWAAHTPATLERQCLGKLVEMVLDSAIPVALARLPAAYTYAWGQPSLSMALRCRRLDKIMLATDAMWPDILQEKKDILNRLQNVRQWWDDGLSLLGSDMGRIARQAVSLELQLIDPEATFPLMRLVLQLLFSSSAGTPHNVVDFPFIPKIRLELHREVCPAYAAVLQDLAPFKIEEISTQHIIFADVEPWVVIIKGCPQLQRIHLRHNADPHLLTALCACTRLHTFILDECLGSSIVPVDTLYQMFFKGKNHQEVSDIVSSKKVQNTQTLLTFSNLKFVDLGNNWDSYKGDGGKSMTELRYNLLYFYPGVQSLSCENMRPFRPRIPPNLPPHCHALSYNLTHLDLYYLMMWAKHKCSELTLEQSAEVCATLNVFKRVRHLTLTHAPEIMQDATIVKKLADFTKMCMPKLKCGALTLNFPFTFPPTTVDLLAYLPILEAGGGQLRVLRLHFSCGMVAVGSLYPLLACCPNLEVLGLVWARGAADDFELQENTVYLPHLVSLSVVVQDGAGASVVEGVVERLLKACPALNTLELVLPHHPCEWLMTLAAQRVLAKVRTLRLSFRPGYFFTHSQFEEEEDVGLMFYLPFIELLPSLKVLLLGDLPLIVYRRLTLTFLTSRLRILPRPQPLTHTLHPYL